MSDFYGRHFEFGNASTVIYRSATDHLVFANLDTSRYMRLYGNISGVGILTRADKRRILIDDDYSDFPVSIDMELFRDDGEPIPKARQRALETILFGDMAYRRVYIDRDDDPDGDYYEDVDVQGVTQQKRLFLMARFMNPERIEFDCKVYGYRFTLETDSGMWTQETIGYHFYPESDDAGELNFEVYIDTDLPGYMYQPTALTSTQEGGDITWVNLDDDANRLTTFVNMPSHATVHIDGKINYIDEGFYNRFQNMNFPRFVNGRNRIRITGAIAAAHVNVTNRRRF